MTKYKKAFQEMLSDHQDLFDSFQKLHEQYQGNKTEYQDQFNNTGTEVIRIIRRYENALCSKSENSGYGKFSTSLSDKFWEEVRLHFPLIDAVRLQ